MARADGCVLSLLTLCPVVVPDAVPVCRMVSSLVVPPTEIPKVSPNFQLREGANVAPKSRGGESESLRMKCRFFISGYRSMTLVS